MNNIIQFGKREFNEKKPISLEILRVKSKTILKLGFLPSLKINQLGTVRYLVVADYKDHFRIYSFTSNGLNLGGENLEKTPKLLRILKKEAAKDYK